jgi:hemoglobin
MHAAIILLATAGLAAADQPAEPLSRKALDEAVYDLTRDMLAEGAQLYNAGYQTACAYLFRGALTSMAPLLDHRPDLQRAVRQGLANAQRMASVDDRAWALHYLLVRVQTDLRPAALVLNKNTLWGRLGGQPGVTKIVDDWINEALKDPRVNLNRDGRFLRTAQDVAQFKDRLVQLASAAGGGPNQYQGRFMKPAHAGMGITDDEFDAFLSHLKLALMRHEVSFQDIQAILGRIAAVRSDIVQVAVPAAPGAPPATLWARLGGRPGVTKIVDEWINEALKDPRVNFTRNNRFPMPKLRVDQLKFALVTLASSVGGGPDTYQGRTMKELHAGMRITAAEFDALVSDLEKVLGNNKVSEKDIALILKAVEATRKDIVEGKGGMMPAPQPAAGGAGARGNVAPRPEPAVAAAGSPAEPGGWSYGGWFMKTLAHAIAGTEPGDSHAP